jgi:GGDEF domain-containing protein
VLDCDDFRRQRPAGHEFGDALREIGHVPASSLRRRLLARLGGDEFVVMLPATGGRRRGRRARRAPARRRARQGGLPLT